MLSKINKFIRSDAAKPIRFAFVGGLATATHLAVAGLVLLGKPDAPPYLVNIAAFLVAFLVSFYGHRHLTFRVPGSMKGFFLVAAGGFLLNNFILTVCLAGAIPPFISITIATICVPVVTYLASARWAFK